MKRDLYKEWKQIEKNNDIIDSYFSGWGDKSLTIDDLPRCEDGFIYYYGDLYVSNEARKYPKLPDNFVVYGCVNVNSIKLKELPKGFTVHGDLSCAKNNIKVIPPDLVVCGEFNCSYNKITEIPLTIKIKFELYCDSNKLDSIPNDLDVGGDIHCGGNNFKFTKAKHKHKIFVDYDNQELQDRYLKINKVLELC